MLLFWELVKGVQTMEKFTREIMKRENCSIRISTEDISGHHYIEIRQYYKEKSNDFVPSQKGVTFNSKHLDEFIDNLLALKRFMVQNM